MIKKILLGLADSPYTETASRRAIELAELHGASLTCVTLVDPDRLRRVGPYPVGGAHAAQQMGERRVTRTRERVEITLQGVEAACAERGIPCKVVRSQGNPVRILSEHARSHDLVLSGLRGVLDPEHLSASISAVYELTASGGSPVIAEPSVYRPVHRALVAYDGSPAAARALKTFAQAKIWPDAEVRVVNFGNRAEAGEKLIEEALDILRSAGVAKASGEFVKGRVTPGLASYADSYDADVIVVGNKARSFLLRHVVHDTTRDLIKNGARSLFMAH